MVNKLFGLLLLILCHTSLVLKVGNFFGLQITLEVNDVDSFHVARASTCWSPCLDFYLVVTLVLWTCQFWTQLDILAK